MKTLRLTPPADSREEVAYRLSVIERQRDLGAVLGVNPLASQRAEECYRSLRRGNIQGPLHGVPLIIKDNIACASLPITLGCRALSGVRAQTDALVVSRLRAAGAIILARANMSEFAFDVRSRSSLGGDVRNPLMPETTAGGSSGGCAAAVAAGMADGAIGTDTGGSVRIPCSYTGLVGLRPRFRRAMLAGIAPLSLSKDTAGPMAHGVQDAALLHAIIHGIPVQPLAVRTLRGARLGVFPALAGDCPVQRKVWTAALDTLQQAGAILIETALPEQKALASATCLSVYEFRTAIDRWLSVQKNAPSGLENIYRSGAFLPEFNDFLQHLLTFSHLKQPLWQKERRFQRLLRQALAGAAAARRLDAFVYPTVRQQPVSLAKMPPGLAPELAAISGWPALTLPCGIASSGLPVGLELLTPRPDEHALLVLALACENALSVEIKRHVLVE